MLRVLLNFLCHVHPAAIGWTSYSCGIYKKELDSFRPHSFAFLPSLFVFAFPVLAKSDQLSLIMVVVIDHPCVPSSCLSSYHDCHHPFSGRLNLTFCVVFSQVSLATQSYSQDYNLLCFSILWQLLIKAESISCVAGSISLSQWYLP